MLSNPIVSTSISAINVNHKERSKMVSADIAGSNDAAGSPRARPWSAADSDKCECVLEVMNDDVLLGRGSGPNDHVGNIKFRDLVHARKSEYLSTNHRQTKALIAKEIVDQVYAHGGRFLKKLGPVESAKILPKLLAQNKIENSGTDRSDDDRPCDVYQIQKHSTVMEKAKQALRQNQRNGSVSPPDTPKKVQDGRRNSLGHGNKMPNDPQTHGILINNSSNNMNNNWGGMGMGTMNIPTTLNARMSGGSQSNNHNNQHHQGGQFHGQNPGMDSYDNINQDSYQQQMLQQQQNLMNLKQQHEMLQMQFQHQQQNQTQFQSQQLEMEKHNQLLQEQLELQIRQEQLRQLQQESLQKLRNNAAMYARQQPQQGSPNNQQQQYQQPERTTSQSQSQPPAVLNGYATYTTTLDAVEDARHSSTDGLADPHETIGVLKGGEEDGDSGKNFDDKSMQMSTMMGSFKDMSVREGDDHSMHGSGDTIGTIEGSQVEGLPGTLVNAYMSGMSMMSMMNDSNEDFMKDQQKAGKKAGAPNASWATDGSPVDPDVPNSSQEPLADVRDNPAAEAAAAILGQPFPKVQRRWSGGYMPREEEPPPVRRFNRRGSLQYTSTNTNMNPEMNQSMSTANTMLAMRAQQLQHGQNFSNYNDSYNNQGQYGGGQEMMNPPNQGYNLDQGAYHSGNNEWK